MQGSNGIFDSLCHLVYSRLLRNIFTTDNSFDSGFHAGEILVVILVQCICFGNGCIYLSIISILVLQGSNGIFNSFRHCINFGLLRNIFTTGHSIHSGFHAGEILVVILLQSVCFGNGFVNLCVISILVLQGSNGIFNSFRHCINLCLLGFAFCSVNRVNGIFYPRIICIKAAIKSRCPCDGCIDSCVISGDVIVIPHKSWMTDSGNPFNARTGIGLQASKNIVRVKVVGSGSGWVAALFIRNIWTISVISRPETILCIGIYDIPQPASVFQAVVADSLRSDKTVDHAHTLAKANNTANRSLNGVYNDFSTKPTVAYCHLSRIRGSDNATQRIPAIHRL